MDIVIVTTIAQIVQRLLAHMSEDAHYHYCIVNDALGIFHAKCAANARMNEWMNEWMNDVFY